MGQRSNRISLLSGGVLLCVVAALSACDDASSASPEELIKRADTHRSSGDRRAAVIELRNALQKAPDNVVARTMLAEIYLRVGDGAAAETEIRAVRQRMQLDVADPMLARSMAMQGKFDQLVREIVPSPDEPMLIAPGDFRSDFRSEFS